MECIGVILAGGKGSRMHRKGNKVLELVCGKPIICYLVEKLKNIGIERIIVVVGYKAEEVKAVLGNSVEYATQLEQLGTGDAFLQAYKLFTDYQGNVLLLNGDGPIIDNYLLKEMTNLNDCQVKILSGDFDCSCSFGRIIRDEFNNVFKIVEMRDCTKNQLKITEMNLGVYCFKNTILSNLLAKMSRNNAQNEYYVTDLIDLAVKKNYIVNAYKINKNDVCIKGANTLIELAEMEKSMQVYINKSLCEKGVRVIDINNTYIDANSKIDSNCTIEPNVHIKNSVIGENCYICANCYIENSFVRPNIKINANSVIDSVNVKENVNPATYLSKIYEKKKNS